MGLLEDVQTINKGKQPAQPADGLLADIRAIGAAPCGKTYGANQCDSYVKDNIGYTGKLSALPKVNVRDIRDGDVVELKDGDHWALFKGGTLHEWITDPKTGKVKGESTTRSLDSVRSRIASVRRYSGAGTAKTPAPAKQTALSPGQKSQWQGGWQFSEPQVDTRTAVAGGMGYSGGRGGAKAKPQPKPAAAKQTPILDMIPREPALTKQDVTARNKAINERMWALTKEVNTRVFPEPKKQFDENEYKYLLSRLKEPWEQEYVKRGVDEELRRQGTEPSTREGLVAGLLMAGSGVNLGVGGLVSRAAAKPGIVGKAAGAVEKAIKPVAQAAQQTGKTGLAARTVERIPRGAVENVLFEAVANPSELRERALPAAALGAAFAGGLGGVMDVAGGMKPHVRPAAEPPVADRPVAPLAEAPATLEAMARARTAAQSQYRADVRRLKPPVEATPGRATTPLPKVGESVEPKLSIGQLNAGDRFSWKPGGKVYIAVAAEGKGGKYVKYIDANGKEASVTHATPVVRAEPVPLADTTPTPAVAESRVAPWTEPQTPPMQGARMGESIIGKTYKSTLSGDEFTPVKIVGDEAYGADGRRVKLSNFGPGGYWKQKPISPSATPTEPPGARMAETPKVEVAKPASTVVTQARPTEYRVKIYEDDRGKFWIEPWGKSPKSGKWEKMFNRVSPEFMDEYFRAEGIDLSTLPKTEVVWNAPKKKYVPRAKPPVAPVEPPVAAKPTGGAVAPKAAAETGVAKPPPAKVVAQQADAVPDAQLAEVLQAGDEFKKNILANTRQYNTDVTKPHRSRTHLIPTDAEIRKGFTQPQLEFFKDALKAEIPDALAKPGGEFVVKIPDDGTFTVPKTPQAIGLHLNTLGEAKPKLTAPVKISRDARVLQYDGNFGEAVTADGRPVWTNGAMLEFDNPPSGFRQVADSKSALRVVKPDNILAWAESKGKSQPLEYVGTSFGWSQEGVKPTTSPNGPKAAKPGDAIVFRSSDGSLIAVDAKYHNYFAGKYKGARFGAIAEEGKSPTITVSVGGKTKAYVGPLADDVIPSEFRDVAPTPTKPTAAPKPVKAKPPVKAAKGGWRNAEVRTPEMDAQAKRAYAKATKALDEAETQQRKIKLPSDASPERIAAAQKAYDAQQKIIDANKRIRQEAEAYAQKPVATTPPTARAASEGALKAASEAKAAGKPSGGSSTTLGYRGTAEIALTRPQAARTKTGVPVKASDIVKDLDAAFAPIRTGRFRQRALGIFKVEPNVVRSVKANDLPVISHETGHALHKLLWPEVRTPKGGLAARAFSREFWPELRELAYPKAKQKVVEGYAEYIRLWLTDHAAAVERAPEFSKFFDAKLKQYPQVLKVMERARADIRRWAEQPAQARVRSTISRNEPDVKRAVDLDRIYALWVDELQPLIRAEQEITKGAKVKATESPSLTAWANRGLSGKTEEWLLSGVKDAQGKTVGKSLRDTLAPVAREIDDFSDFAVARHALDVIDSGKPMPLPRMDYQAVVDAAPEQYVKVLGELITYQDRLLNELVGSGMLSRESANLMRKKWPNHVPLYRVMDETVRKPGIGRGQANLQSPVKRLKGSGRDIIDPIESIVKDTQTFLNIAARNRVMVKLTDLAGKFEDAGRIVEVKIPPKMRPTSFTLDEILRGDEHLIGTEKAAASMAGLDLDQVRTIFRPSYVPSGKENIVTVYRKGMPELYQLDPELHAAVTAADTLSADILTKMLAAPASILRAGATLTPEFAIRNPIRDIPNAIINSEYGLKHWDIPRALFHVIGRTDMYHQWKSAGGAHASMVSLDRNYLQGAVRNVMRQSPTAKVIDFVSHPIDALRALSELTEETTRVAEFGKGTRWGKTTDPNRLIEAAIASRDITVDFSRAGTIGKKMNRITAFFNATIGGADKTARVFKQNPIRSTKRAVAYITAPTVALYMLNRNDPRYQERQEWEKDLFWFIPTPEGMPLVRIPKPFELGVIFGSLPERILRWADKQDPHAFDDYARDAWESFTPSVLPTALTPWMQVISNRTFAGSPIIPRREENMPPALQSGSDTSLVAQIVGQKLNYSPRQIDHLLRGYFGGLGRYATQGIDAVLERTGAVRPPPRVAKPLSGKPVIRALLANEMSSPVQVERMYRRLSVLETLDKKADAGIGRKMTAFETSELDKLKGQAKELSDLRKRERAVTEAKNQTELLAVIKKYDLPKLVGSIEEQKLAGILYLKELQKKVVAGQHTVKPAASSGRSRSRSGVGGIR